MKKNMVIRQKNKFYLIVAFLQLLGGTFLLIIIFQNFAITFPIIIALLFVIIGFLSSILLLIDNEYGVSLAIINYSLQLFKFSIPDIMMFKYDIPIYGNIIFDFNRLYLYAETGIKTLIELNFGYPESSFIGINIFSLVILRLLLYDKDKLKTKIGWITYQE